MKRLLLLLMTLVLTCTIPNVNTKEKEEKDKIKVIEKKSKNSSGKTIISLEEDGVFVNPFRAIIGVDNRTQVFDTTISSFDGIVRLKVCYPAKTVPNAYACFWSGSGAPVLNTANQIIGIHRVDQCLA